MIDKQQTGLCRKIYRTEREKERQSADLQSLENGEEQPKIDISKLIDMQNICKCLEDRKADIEIDGCIRTERDKDRQQTDLQSLEKRQPNAKPSQGRAKPTSPTRQLINLIMKNWDQIPHTEHRKINRLIRQTAKLTAPIARQIDRQPKLPADQIDREGSKID